MGLISTGAGSVKEIITEIPGYVRVYNDGTVERLLDTPIVPPTLEDPTTGTSSKDVVISNNPPISARLYRPKSIQRDRVPILVYFHGGGFFFESTFNQLHQNYFNLVVPQVNALVVSVEYRLAPETLLPAAYDDCWDALKWLASNTDPWLINHGDFNRVFIGGDSAGGNIAHNIALRAGVEALPCGVKVLGALLSHAYVYGSKPIGSEPVEGREEGVNFLAWGFAYPTAPGGIDNPMINPFVIGAPSLAGLGCSKLLICIAEKDSLRDRGVLYYEAVKESGWQGQAELFEVEGEGHVFHIHNPESENAKKMFARFADFFHH